jgi:hypothetical protein
VSKIRCISERKTPNIKILNTFLMDYDKREKGLGNVFVFSTRGDIFGTDSLKFEKNDWQAY